MKAKSLAATFVITIFGGAAAWAQGDEFLISDFTTNSVQRFDFNSGAHLGSLDTILGPQGIIFGPDGNLYVAAEGEDKVFRYDPQTLLRIDEFVGDDPATGTDETGGLNGPTGLAFGADGNLYVASFNTDSVLRYDGTSGTFIDIFVNPGAGGLNGPDAGIAFGPDGHLYVPSFFNHRVLHYDSNGQSLGPFIAAGSGGLTNPRTIVFRSDGISFVSSEGSNAILQYDTNGSFLSTFITVNSPTGFAISPLDGHIYATSVTRNFIRRYDGTNGDRDGIPVPAGSGGLTTSVFLALVPQRDLRISRLTPGQTGVVNSVTVEGATPSSPLFFIAGTLSASIALGGCEHRFLGIGDPTLILTQSDVMGSLQLSGLLDGALSGSTLRYQAIDLTTCRISNLVEQTLP